MTKRITILFAALVCCATSFAQKVEVRRLEGEIGVGLVNGVNSFALDACNVGPKLYGELRYNFRFLPIDVGLQVSGSYFHREIESQAERQKSKSYNVMAVADYNLFRGRKFSVFAGVGGGLGVLDMSYPINIKAPDAHWAGYSTGDGQRAPYPHPARWLPIHASLRVADAYLPVPHDSPHHGSAVTGR